VPATQAVQDVEPAAADVPALQAVQAVFEVVVQAAVAA
jgi:hypothetical protein